MSSYLMDLITARIASSAPMTIEQIIQREVEEWKNSAKRSAMLDGARYYRGEQDILEMYRYTLGKDGKRLKLNNLPNNKNIDNQFAIAVDKKTNHLLGQPITLKSDNEQALKAVKPYMGAKFMRCLRRAAKEAMQGGVAYVFPYYDKTGELSIKILQNSNVIAFYEDEDESILDAFIYLHEEVEYEGTTKKLVEKVDFCSKEGFIFFENKNGNLKRIGEQPHLAVKVGKGDPLGRNWQKIPLIPFRYNSAAETLLSRVKSLQDGINTILSTFENNMEEDCRNTILVVHNYDGTNVGELREIMAQVGVIKVADDGSRKGGVDTLTIEVNSENYRSILAVLKNALIENARSFDAKDERMLGNPNQMNIQAMLLDMEMDANGMETEFQPALEELLWFIAQDIATKGKGSIELGSIEFIFNRDTLIDETTVISNIKASTGIISHRTQLEQHPWIDNVEEELKRIEIEKAAALADLYNARIVAEQANLTPSEGKAGKVPT